MPKFSKGATTYGIEFRRFGVRWCYLYGGHWKHPFQPSRWSFYRIDKEGNIISN
jgi:hypothetical protein